MKRLIALIAALCVPLMTNAGEPPISISMAISSDSDRNGGRWLGYRFGERDHLYVVITNTSRKTQKIWQESCSWGYYRLTFEFTDRHGKKWEARKNSVDWTANYPRWWILEPKESMVWDVDFGDTKKWRGFPEAPKFHQDNPPNFNVKAVLEVFPDEESRKYRVWTGRVVSKALNVTFYP